MATVGPTAGEGPVSGLDNRTTEPGTGTGDNSNETTDFGQDVMNSIQSISQPVEMTDLSNNPTQVSPASGQSSEATSGLTNAVDATASNSTAPADGVDTAGPLPIAQQNPAPSDSGIGPATDRPAVQRTASSDGAQLVITLLLHSTETRHPYTIDENYLKRRNVNVADNNPINMTVYTLKELILRDWRSEWEARPTSPTSIRLIHMGRMLDDKVYLKDSRFSNGNTPHIVHMTIKPQEAIDEEDARIAKGGGRERDGSERSPGCRCTIM